MLAQNWNTLSFEKAIATNKGMSLAEYRAYKKSKNTKQN